MPSSLTVSSSFQPIPVRLGGGPAEVVGNTIQEQTRQALGNVETVLKAAGNSLNRVVKVTVLLARSDLYSEMNEAYAEFFPGAKPARAMVRFGDNIPDVLVAIEAVALVSGRRKRQLWPNAGRDCACDAVRPKLQGSRQRSRARSIWHDEKTPNS